MTSGGIVIVGAGEAGVRTAVELRNQGWDGSITLVGEETWLPYERPPLSKSLLLAESELAPVFVLNQERLSQHNIEFLSGSAVTEIDRNSHLAVLSDGREIGYHKLLLATGARPRRLSHPICYTSEHYRML